MVAPRSTPKAETCIKILFLSLSLILLQPTLALSQGISEKHQLSFCGASQIGDWPNITGYAANNAKVTTEVALSTVSCTLSKNNSDQYIGNILHSNIRKNPSGMKVTLDMLKFLFDRKIPADVKAYRRAIFIDLIRGVGADHDTFYQAFDTIEEDPVRQDHGIKSGKLLFKAIDRHSYTKLSDLFAKYCHLNPLNISRK